MAMLLSLEQMTMVMTLSVPVPFQNHLFQDNGCQKVAVKALSEQATAVIQTLIRIVAAVLLKVCLGCNAALAVKPGDR